MFLGPMMNTAYLACTPQPSAKPASWVDRLLDGLFCWLDASLVKRAAGELARECRDTIWEHIYQRTSGMGHAQARGYVRAVAPAFLSKEVDLVLNRHRAGAFLRPHVLARALEEVVDLVADDVVRAQVRTSSLAKAA
jgi:hypothetical protein